MKPLTFERKALPEQRIDLSPLIPAKLAGLSRQAIEALPIQTTRHALAVGDIFKIGGGEPASIRIVGATDRFDCVGAGLDGGEVVVDGDVGELAGRLMSGGRVTITGNAGPWAGSGMTGGRLAIGGNAGDRLAGPLPGEMAGMRGGLLTVGGDAGAMAADRLRRGIVAIAGRAGDYAGNRMIAGTLIVAGRAGRYPGYLMRRGTILLRREPERLSPTFVPGGRGADVFRSLLVRDLDAAQVTAAWIAKANMQRFGGDTAVMGKGELFMPG